MSDKCKARGYIACNSNLKADGEDAKEDVSSRKKSRLHGGEDIFQRFNNCPEMVSAVKTSCENLSHWKHYALTGMTVRYCNAAVEKNYGFSFFDAQCLTEFYAEKVFSFLNFFSYGRNVLRLCTENGTLPEDPHLRQILRRLIIYLLDCKDDQEALKKMTQTPNVSKSVLAAAYGQHLLSKLSVSASYTLDKLYDDDSNSDTERKTCPCGCQHEFAGLFGDNSIGNPRCWHGNMDIFVPGADLAVTVIKEEKPTRPDGKSEVEVKVNEDIQSDKSTQRSLAQTIVFSFLQKKRHPEYEHFFIPTISISKKELLFYFYDSEQDILMKSPPFSLFTDSETMNLETILACWFILHYRAFGTGVPDDFSATIPRANFHKMAKEKVDVYEKELRIGGVTGKSFNFHFQPHVWYNAEFCE